MPFWYLTHAYREWYKKKKIVSFLFKSVRIASYVRKPVKTVKIRKTHVKNIQVDTSDLKVNVHHVLACPYTLVHIAHMHIMFGAHLWVGQCPCGSTWRRGRHLGEPQRSSQRDQCARSAGTFLRKRDIITNCTTVINNATCCIRFRSGIHRYNKHNTGCTIILCTINYSNQ